MRSGRLKCDLIYRHLIGFIKCLYSVHVYGHCNLQGRLRDSTDFSEVYKWFRFSSDILSYVVELKFHQRFSFACGIG